MTRPKEKTTRKKPSPIKWDHDALEAAFYANGHDFLLTSEITGCPKNTLYQVSKRKKWKSAGNAQRQLIEARNTLKELQPEVVTSSAESVAKSIDHHKETFLAGMSSGLSRAASVVSSMDGSEVVENSRKIHDLIQSGSKLFGIGIDSNAPGLTLNVLSLSADQLRPL